MHLTHTKALILHTEQALPDSPQVTLHTPMVVRNVTGVSALFLAWAFSHKLTSFMPSTRKGRSLYMMLCAIILRLKMSERCTPCSSSASWLLLSAVISAGFLTCGTDDVK